MLQAVVFFYLSWTDSRFKNEVLAATNASLNDPHYNNGQVLTAEHSGVNNQLLTMTPALTLWAAAIMQQNFGATALTMHQPCNIRMTPACHRAGL